MNRLKRLLGVESPACDNLVREAALKATAILVRKYVDIGENLSHATDVSRKLPRHRIRHGWASSSLGDVASVHIRIRVHIGNEDPATTCGCCEMSFPLH